MATTPVTFDAVPVVFWLSVGNVQFVRVPEEGVPSAPPGATKSVPAVAAVNAAVPLPLTRPVRVVVPVPPLATTSVPARVNVPDPVIGPPAKVRPVVPPDAATDVTVPPPAVEVMVTPPALFEMDIPEPAVSVAMLYPVPLPIRS
jgi:hypothetical protein